MALQRRLEQYLALLPENQEKLKLKNPEKFDSLSYIITTCHSQKLSLLGRCICLFKINISDLDGIYGWCQWSPNLATLMELVKVFFFSKGMFQCLKNPEGSYASQGP